MLLMLLLFQLLLPLLLLLLIQLLLLLLLLLLRLSLLLLLLLILLLLPPDLEGPDHLPPGLPAQVAPLPRLVLAVLLGDLVELLPRLEEQTRECLV